MIRSLIPGPDFIDPIPANAPATWSTTAIGVLDDGTEVTLKNILYFEASQEGIGKLQFGVRNWPEENKRHGWVFTDRGGVVIIAVAEIDGREYYGLLKNVRQLAHHDRSPIAEFARGFFTDRTNNGRQTVNDEFGEEAGFDPKNARCIDATAQLGIEGGTNWNSTFNDTGSGNGVEHWILQVPATALTPVGDGTYTFRPEVLAAQVGTPSGAPGERVMKSVFYPSDRLPITADGFTLQAYGIIMLRDLRPNTSLTLNRIRREAERREDGVDFARNAMREAGFGETESEMLALAVRWRENREQFMDICRSVSIDESMSPYWRARANGHLGAVTDSAESAVRIMRFENAIRFAGSLPLGERLYYEHKAYAGLADTHGLEIPIERLIDGVQWMVHWGTFDGPGRADAVVKRLLAEGRRDEAKVIGELVLKREERGDTCFSTRQLQRLKDTIEANGL